MENRLNIFAEIEDYIISKKRKWNKRGKIPLLAKSHIRKKKDEKIAKYYGILRKKMLFLNVTTQKELVI